MIRKANINDAKDIVKINMNGWKETYKGIFPQKFLDKLNIDDEISIKKCEDKIQEYAVCEIDNKVVSIIRYGKNKKDFNNNYGEIHALYIDNAYQHQGIGTKLVQFAINELKNNYKSILVSTLVENPANKFYKKIGGTLIGNSDFILENKAYKENLYELKIKESNQL